MFPGRSPLVVGKMAKSAKMRKWREVSGENNGGDHAKNVFYSRLHDVMLMIMSSVASARPVGEAELGTVEEVSTRRDGNTTESGSADSTPLLLKTPAVIAAPQVPPTTQGQGTTRNSRVPAVGAMGTITGRAWSTSAHPQQQQQQQQQVRL